jgi:hypothetical protein
MVNGQRYEFPKGANTAFVYHDGSVHFVELPEEYFIRLPLSFLYEDHREPLLTLRSKRGYRAFVRWDLLEQRPEWPLVEGDRDDYPEFLLKRDEGV